MTDARDVIARAIDSAGQDDPDGATCDEFADAVLVALAAAGLTITETPELERLRAVEHAWAGVVTGFPEVVVQTIGAEPETWEYGARWDDEDWTVEKPTEAHARAYVGQKCIHGGPITVVRRHPAGPWEVAP